MEVDPTHGRPPAGWYPDPGGEGARWWDGYAWTEHTAPVPGDDTAPVPGDDPAPVPAARVPAPPHPGHPGVETGWSAGEGPRWRWDPSTGWQWVPGPAWEGQATWSAGLRPAVGAERRMGAVARGAIVAVAAVSLAAAAVRLDDASAMAAYFHWVRLAWDAAERRLTPPAPPAMPTAYVTATYLSSLVELAMGVVFLVWQHRAAAVARGLGLPAAHSPGWGVGFWFVPVANLWCPYQALRDCLPPGHPARRRVLGCWLLYLATGLTAAAGFVASGFSRPAAAALLAVLAVLWIGLVVLGGSLVRAIGDAHRTLAGG